MLAVAFEDPHFVVFDLQGASRQQHFVNISFSENNILVTSYERAMSSRCHCDGYF